MKPTAPPERDAVAWASISSLARWRSSTDPYTAATSAAELVLFATKANVVPSEMSATTGADRRTTPSSTAATLVPVARPGTGALTCWPRVTSDTDERTSVVAPLGVGRTVACEQALAAWPLELSPPVVPDRLPVCAVTVSGTVERVGGPSKSTLEGTHTHTPSTCPWQSHLPLTP